MFLHSTSLCPTNQSLNDSPENLHLPFAILLSLPAVGPHLCELPLYLPEFYYPKHLSSSTTCQIDKKNICAI